MTNSLLPSREPIPHRSTEWFDSERFEGVRFLLRQPSLLQRIQLVSSTRELLLKHEFLRSGDSLDHISANLAELEAKRIYVDWGLVALEGLLIDGEPATPKSLVDSGPEELTDEIFRAITANSELTADERKNS